MEKKLLRNVNGYTEFKAKYTFFDCNREYPGWTGEERYAIYADCNVSEIEKEFPELIAAMSPVLIMPTELKPIRDKYKRNEDKYEKRNKHNQSIFDLDEEAERIHPELCVPDFLTEMIEKQDEDARQQKIVNICRAALSTLTAKQQENLVDYYVNEKTMQQIADERHCSKATIGVSIVNAKEKFLKAYENMLTNGTPNSMHYEGLFRF